MLKRICAALCILAMLLLAFACAESEWVCINCGKHVQAMFGDICPYCGAEKHEHTWQEATCNTPRTCSGCGETEGTPLGHAWQEATCTQPKTCTRCGLTEGAALGHQWDEGAVIQAATCREPGKNRFTCVRCGKTRDEMIPVDPANHTGGTEIRDAVEATATADGYTGDTYCRGCAQLISKGSRIEASSWQKAAEQGDPEAQYQLGRMYRDGTDVPQDYEKAAEWFRKAAEQGNADAQNDLGVLYELGNGVPQSYTEAANWYRKAAEQGNMYAQCNLGISYKDGNGVTQDYAEAAAWFRKAAEQGHADAQNWLGVLYENGDGVPQSYTEALNWYRKAAEQGNEDARKKLDRLKENHLID